MAKTNPSPQRTVKGIRRHDCIIAIDPGLEGAVAVYDPSAKKLVTVWEIPTIVVQKGRKREQRIDAVKLGTWLTEAIVEYGVSDIVLEEVHSSPQMGVKSAFSFGRTFGKIETVCELYGPKLHRVSPAVWKARMVVKGDKKQSVLAAQKLFGVNPWFNRISYDGRAEAALLAVYAARDLISVEEDYDPLS